MKLVPHLLSLPYGCLNRRARGKTLDLLPIDLDKAGILQAHRQCSRLLLEALSHRSVLNLSRQILQDCFDSAVSRFLSLYPWERSSSTNMRIALLKAKGKVTAEEEAEAEADTLSLDLVILPALAFTGM
jgi:hypothetical protein